MTHNENGGGITTVTNASGVITSEFADLLGRPFKTISGATGLTQWGYYAPGTLGGWGGKLASMTDGDYVTSASGYNAKGQRTTTSRTVPLLLPPLPLKCPPASAMS